jgi:hypothetical protein
LIKLSQEIAKGERWKNLEYYLFTTLEKISVIFFIKLYIKLELTNAQIQDICEIPCGILWKNGFYRFLSNFPEYPIKFRILLIS